MRASALWLSALLLILASCNADRNFIAIDSKAFDDEIEVVQNLDFKLNKHIFNDSLFDTWTDAELVTFDPPVKGRFRIVSSDAFYFSPFEHFAESEMYTATLNKAIYDFTNVTTQIKTAAEHFHTPLLEINSINTYWYLDNQTNSVKLNADILFNANINPAALSPLLSVQVNDAEVTSSITIAQAAATIPVSIGGLDPKNPSNHISLEIKPGLSAPGSRYKTEKPIRTQVDIPPVEDLEIKDVTAEHDGLSGTVTVVTNQQISNPNMEQLIQIDPKVDFTVERTLNGLIINSEGFNPSTTYTLTLSDQLTGVAGGKMVDAFKQSIAFGEMEPQVEFVSNTAKYLSAKGQRNLAFRIVNVPKVKVEVIKIYENNILNFMRDGFEWDWYESYDEEEQYWDYHDYRSVRTELYGNVVYSKEYESSKLEKYSGSRILNLDFSDKLEKFDGIYVVRVSATDKQWLTDAQVVSVSDIGLIAKASEDELLVFANSLQTAEPMSGIKISFISSNNQKLYTATTDKSGVAVFTGIKKEFPEFSVNLITAKSGTDYTYLPFSQTEVSTSRFEVGGKRINETGLDAFLYPERDLYRPGETMHIAGIIRGYDWSIPEPIPVRIQVNSPSGKEFKSVRKTLSNQGGFETAIEIPNGVMTGTYTVQLYSSNDIVLATKYISVEEFMPDRIKVTAHNNKKEYKPGETITSTIQADNLYGTPASERNWQSELNIWPDPFYSSKYPNFDFTIYDGEDYFETLTTEGQTDEAGAGVATYDINANYANQGILQGRILTTVFDESGRPVYATEDFKIVTQQTMVGVGNIDYYVRTKTPLKVPVIAVDKDDKGLRSTEAKIEVIKFEYETVIERNNHYYTYRSNEKAKIVQSHTVKVNGESTAVWFTPEQSGKYEIRVHLGNAATYVKQQFYAYGFGTTQNNAFEVSTEGNVQIVSDKEKYQTGETANLLFTTPFNGNLLVTVERNHVLEHHYIKTEKKSASLTVKLDQSHVPNIFVTATLFRPNDDSGMPLTVAHGIVNLKVDNASKHIPLTVTHEKQSRSNKKQTIQIKTAPNAQLTVAVVDEGILQIKNFETPDPYKWFYMQHALGVMSYDMYAQLYPEIYLKKMLSGGDGGMMEGRLNPMTANRVKLVSFWSGIITADASGKASYTIDIPQFSGDLRVMVAAYKQDQFGASETHMKVADPIVVTTSLPRFLTPGDTITLPVTLANTTAKAANGNVKVTVEGPLKIVGSTNASFDAKANKETRTAFKLYTTGSTGVGKVTVQVQALNETFTDVTEIAIRPPGSLQMYSGEGVLHNSGKASVAMTNNLIPETATAKLIVSRSPLIKYTNSLDYLVHYPYGCVEQITSTAFPQLYYADLVKSMYKKETNTIDPAYNVQEAIRILQSMQMHNGALSYWPGGGSESWWGTAYASHFLVEAKKAGYDVDNRTLDKMLGYLKTSLKQKRTFVYYYNSSYKREVASKEIFYSLYVLALAGKAEVSTMNYYKANLSMLTLDSKYLLATSYLLAGDKKSSDRVMPPEFAGEESNKEFSGSFSSPIRDRALILNSLLEADPNNQQIGRLAQQLSSMVQDQTYMNTQERSFTFLAFGKIAAKNKNADIKGVVKANGKEIGKFDGKDLIIEDASLLNKNITIESTGSGDLYYFWSTRGLTSDGSYVQEDSKLKVRKTFYDRWGKQMDLRNVQQNDLIVVKITLQTSTGFVDNIAITDILPAGFEIENDRLRSTSSLTWIKDQSTPEYEDIRDDRINIFTQGSTQIRTFYYTVRAVTPGTFKMGPVSAMAMYDESYHSYHGDGWVKIK